MACFINYCQMAGFVLINKTHSGFLSIIVCSMYEKAAAKQKIITLHSNIKLFLTSGSLKNNICPNNTEVVLHKFFI